MFRELYFAEVGFSLLPQSVIRGPLRHIAFIFDKDPSTSISWNPFTRNIKLSGILKKNWSENTNEKRYRWLKRECVCGPSEITLLWKVTFFCRCLRSVDWALEILTENPLAATSAEENWALWRSDDPENTKTLPTSVESCRYFVELCQILCSHKHRRMLKHKSAFRH